MFTPDQILYAILILAITTAVGYWAGKSRDRSNKEDQAIAEVIKDMEQLKVTAVSESRVREIIKDAIATTSADVKEIKSGMNKLNETLHDIQLKLATEIAFKRGKNQRED